MSVLGLLALLAAGACGAEEPSVSNAVDSSRKPKETPMWMIVDGRRFSFAIGDNDTARAFAAQMPLALNMEELNGNEKHARLPAPLPADARRPGRIRAGDLMLYGTDTLVVFYASFDSVYAYTRIGRVNDVAGLSRALGKGTVRIAFSAK